MTDVKEGPAPEERATAEPPRERPTGSATAAATIVTLILAGIVGLSVWYLARPQPLIVQGEADATRIDIAARVDGRVGKRPVERGQNVAAGQLLFEIDNPELITKWREAQAGVDVAQAQLANILVGTRAEVVAQRKAALESAQSNFQLANKTYARVKDLAGSGNAPLQRLDEVTNSLEVAKRDQDRAELAYDEAMNGATKEERAIAQTNVLKAQASVDAIKADVDELTVKAPIAGQVYQIGAEVGEYVSPGVPLLSLIDLGDVWLRFNLREDLVKGLKVGDRFKMRVPALGDKEIEAQIKLIETRGEYAGWRATRATGDFDLRTFAVRAYPVSPLPALRPGMSVYAEWPAGERREGAGEAGTAPGRHARTALDAARRRRARVGPPCSDPRLRHPDSYIQQCGHSQSSRRRRRRRPLGDFAQLCPVDRLRAGRHRRRAVERHEERDAGDPLGRCDRRRLHPREFRARPARSPSAAGGGAIQSAILYARQQRGLGDPERRRRGDRRAAARGGPKRLQAGRPRRRAICPVEPGAQLRPIPAAGGSADCSARRGGDRRRLRRRDGVLSAQQARLDARRGRPAVGRAHRQAHAFVRDLPGHDGGGRRHHPRPLRHRHSEATRCLSPRRPASSSSAIFPLAPCWFCSPRRCRPVSASSPYSAIRRSASPAWDSRSWRWGLSRGRGARSCRCAGTFRS